MPGLAAEQFYSHDDGPPAQGDILLASVSRIIAEDGWSPTRWRVLDAHAAELARAEAWWPALRVAAGRCLAMVTTHDCGLDKEFNAVVDRRLAGASSRSAKREALPSVVASVEDDRTLDRAFQVSPLIDPATVEVGGQAVDQGLLLGNRVIGYLPVPPLDVNGNQLIPVSVVDLSYRATIDRFAYTQRVTSVSETAREQLRYALARLDVLRTPTLETALATAVGQEIRSVRIDKRNPLVVTLTLADNSRIQLLQRPGSPTPGTSGRTRRSLGR